MRFLVDDRGVTPVVATLVLILVAIIGAISIAYLLGAFSTDIAKKVIDPFAPKATPMPGPQILIVDSPQTYQIDEQLAQQYMSTHAGVNIILQTTSDEYIGTESLSQNISDIVALSKAPSLSVLFKDPQIKTHVIGGRAVVVIANSNMSISALSQADLAMVYSQTPQSTPLNLTGLTTVVRNDDGQGSERVFAEWLTDDLATGLENYTATPVGVQSYIAHNETDVLTKVEDTPGAIGFAYWDSITGNKATESRVSVIKIVNKDNGRIQMPSDNDNNNELSSMNDSYYDTGLINGRYYLTEGSPGPWTQEYIQWCQETKGLELLKN